MSKITILEAKTYQGNPSGFKVTLDDGRTGNVQEKGSDKGLRVGDEVLVKEIPYTSKAGVTSTLYGLRLNTGQPIINTPSQQPQSKPQPPQIHVGAGKSKEELKADAASKMAEIVINAFFQDKLDAGQIEVRAREYTKLLWSEIDEIFSTK